MAPRKKTRRYDASRRNGHFTPNEQTPLSSLADKRPPSITKARRRLQFGRKPPKDRSNTDSLETEDQNKEAPLASPLNGTEIETASSSQQQPISNNGHTKRRNPGTRLKKELQFLLDDADHEVYPVRLRSALHELMSCHDYQRREKIPLHRTQEKTDLTSPPSTSRQH